MHALLGSAKKFLFVEDCFNSYETSFDTTLLCHHQLSINNSKTSILFPYFRPSPIFSIAGMPSNSTGSITDINISGIAESRGPADQTAPISSNHTATSRRANHLPPSACILGTDMPIFRKNAAVMEPQLTIREPDVRNAPLPPETHTVWAHFPGLKITWDMLEN